MSDYAPGGEAAHEMAETPDQEAREDAKKYLELIQSYEKHADKWHKRARKIIDLYIEQGEKQRRSTSRRYAMLYANIQVLGPAVYARVPKPIVTRRFKDKDKVAKQASEVLERALVYTLEKSEVDHELKAVRDNYLLAARGTAWVRYDAKIEPILGPDGLPVPTSDGTPAEKISYEAVYADFVNWRDFGHNVARTWKEVFCVWRRVFLTKDELVARFGAEIAKRVDLDHKPDDVPENLLGDEDKKATVFEIWDKRENKVVWVAKNYDKVLDSQPPLLQLEGFFPCPRPAYGVLSHENLMPTPDYVFYQDQAEQINDLTARIDKLTDALKLVGFYPADSENSSAIEKAIKPGTENALVPVPNWAAFSTSGGAASQIQWLPVEQVAKVLNECQIQKASLIQDVYQITGISDIVRGQSNPNETLGAQELKNQWGNIRIRDRQTEMARFARDLVAMMGEVIADRFQPETLLAMTGVPLPSEQEVQQQMAMQAQQAQMQGQPPAPMGEPPVTIEAVMELLRDDRMRCFRIDIETDSTIATDEMQEKQSWSELLTALGGFMQQAIPLGQQAPELAQPMGEMLLSTVRKYRAGRTLEEGLERAVEELGNRIKQQATQPPPVDPKVKQIEMQTQAEQQRLQAESQFKQIEMAHNERMMAMDERLKQIELQIAIAKLNAPKPEAPNASG